MKLNYLLLDVFTRERLKGNPLAVVLKADGLLDGEMQAIAREFNLSETVFIQKPHAERNTASVRIFTPTVELPFAGHPTVGAAVVLGLQNKVSAVRLEEQIGLITALF
jgi:trans-2,3-dihydro-3-hydroxyanthranilate isomerase